jgi:hypothetical protein
VRASFWKRRSTVVVLVLLALAILVRALMPTGIRMAIERTAGDALGRKVEVANVDLGLILGRASVEGLAIGGPDRVAPIAAGSEVVRVGRVGAQIAWLPLLQGKVHLREIALVEPAVRLERNPDGSLAPLVLAPPAPPEPEPPQKGGEGLDLAIDRLSLDRAGLALVRHSDQGEIAELRFENFTLGDLTMQQGVFGIGAVALRGPDLQVHAKGLESEAAPATEPAAPAEPEPAPETPSAPPRHRVKDLNIESAKFAWRMPDGEVIDAELELHAQNLGIGAEEFPIDVRLDTDRAKLSLKGEVALQPVRFDGELRWEDLLLPRLAKLAPDAPVAIEAGRSDGQLQIALRLEDAPDAPAGVQVKGRLGVDNLDLATRDGAATLGWKSFQAELTSFSLPLTKEPAPIEVQFAKLALAQPKVAYQLAPAPVGEAPPAAEPDPAPPAGAAPAEAAPPPRVRIDALELDDGSVRFRDTSLRPPVDTGLESLRVRAQGVRWPERDVAKLLLTAKGARGATLAIDGGVKAGTGNVAVNLSQLPLSPFDPYAGQATGLKIDEGRLSLDAKLALDPKRIGAKSKVSLHKLNVSERESGWFQQAFGVPLDVALALLQDLEGNITIPVDVQQDESGTTVGVAPAVAAALRQAIVGALASPLKLLGSVAGKAGDALSTGLEPIAMAPGAAELGADADGRIAALAQLLASRPGLGVQVLGRAGPEDDPVLARREVIARAKSDQALPGEDQLGFFERRRIRSALAEADPENVQALDAESAAALDTLSANVAVSDDTRQALALARAQAVQRALQQEHGAPADAVAVAVETGAPSVAFELRAQ